MKGRSGTRAACWTSTWWHSNSWFRKQSADANAIAVENRHKLPWPIGFGPVRNSTSVRVFWCPCTARVTQSSNRLKRHVSGPEKNRLAYLWSCSIFGLVSIDLNSHNAERGTYEPRNILVEHDPLFWREAHSVAHVGVCNYRKRIQAQRTKQYHSESHTTSDTHKNGKKVGEKEINIKMQYFFDTWMVAWAPMGRNLLRMSPVIVSDLLPPHILPSGQRLASPATRVFILSVHYL